MVLGTLLIICFMFIFGHIEKAFIVLWILLAFIIIQIPIFGIYFILKKNRDINSLKIKVYFMLGELIFYFFLIQLAFTFIIPPSSIYSNADGDISGLNVNVFTPNGFLLQNQSNCNYFDKLNRSMSYYNTTIDFSKVRIYFGGLPTNFHTAIAMVIGNNVFIRSPTCISIRVFIHEIAHSVISISKWILVWYFWPL